jgi:VanZ family protein
MVQRSTRAHDGGRGDFGCGQAFLIEANPMHKTAAWPLAGIYAALIVYASLYPFEGWRSQGVDWTAFLFAPWPKYWTGFDVLSNVLGYAPLGFIVTLALRRSARHLPAVALSVLISSLLALNMESLQLFLPARVPSNVDWELNTLGAFLGAIFRMDFGAIWFLRPLESVSCQLVFARRQRVFGFVGAVAHRLVIPRPGSDGFGSSTGTHGRCLGFVFTRHPLARLVTSSRSGVATFVAHLRKFVCLPRPC